MLPLLVVVDDLAADPRLAVPVTVAERYLPLPEFARRLSIATKEPIAVAPRMIERKLTLFVDGRPAAETMARIADALSARWERVGAEWHLSPNPKIEMAEIRATREDDALRRATLVTWARIFPADETDGSKTGIVRKAAALWGQRPLPTPYLLGCLTGSPTGRWGSYPMSTAGIGGTAEAPDGMLLLRYNPADETVNPFFIGHGEHSESVVGPILSIAAKEPAPETVLDRLDSAWAKEIDPAVAETRLRERPLEKEPSPSGRMGLADVLARLHARSGLPVAAEAFRVPLAPFHDIPGRTVSAAMAAWPSSLRSDARFLWRTEGGWFLARQPRGWTLRRGEIAEARLVPLEGRRPSIREYASLAGSLSAAQAGALRSSQRPLVDFPRSPLASGYWGLVIYDALDAKAQNAVWSGIRFKDLPSLAQERWDAAMREIALGGSSETALAALYSRVRPSDAGFALSTDTYNSYGDAERGTGALPETTPVHTQMYFFALGLGDDAPAVSMPYGPVKP